MLRFIILGLAFGAIYAERSAIVSFSGDVTGHVEFTEVSDGIQIVGEVEGLTEGKHGFHVHAVGNIYPDCTAAKGHFNPENVNHGGPSDSVRHVGDLGNIEANATGVAVIKFTDNIISLSGDNNIIGRAIVIHQDEDDLGKGNASDSLTTGHAGARVACGVIGTLDETNNNGSTNQISILLAISSVFSYILLKL